MSNSVKKMTFVAVAYAGEATIPVFEKATNFWAYYIEGGKIYKRELLSLFPESTDDLIEKMGRSMFDVLICRNFGPKAMAKLKSRGKRLYTFEGGCDRAVRAFLDEEIKEL